MISAQNNNVKVKILKDESDWIRWLNKGLNQVQNGLLKKSKENHRVI